MLNFYQYHNKKLDMFDIYRNSMQDFSDFLEIQSDIIYPYRQDKMTRLFSRDNYKPIEHIIKKQHHASYYYARYIINGRWSEAESCIMQKPVYALDYARFIIKGRWIEAEPYIMKDNYYWDEYTKLFNC